jgi:predicted CxxxxCH...CXXCH cytochrome family protein
MTSWTRCRSVACAIGAAALLLPGGPAGPAPARAQAKESYKYTGAASCSASNCHGSTKPRADYPRMNESVVWFQKDKHAKAYATLTNEKLKSGVSPSKIARELKIAKAETSDRCLNCHAVNVRAELRGPKFDITEGVHCDGCHGPAEKWLEPHAEKGWTHEQSVKLGMYDTKDLFLRAEKCVSCHLAIDHELVAAGHPDLLAFELDTFSASMPPHWRDKGTWFGSRAWATGQAVALRAAAQQLADRAPGAPPKLLGEAWAKARGHAVVFRHALAVAAPDAQKTLEQAVAALGDAVGKGDRPKIGAAAAEVARLADRVARAVAQREFDGPATRTIMQRIAADGEAIAAAGLRGAEQAAMALDRLYATYSKAPGQKADPAVNAVLDRLFQSLETPAKFDPKPFAAALGDFLKALR